MAFPLSWLSTIWSKHCSCILDYTILMTFSSTCLELNASSISEFGILDKMPTSEAGVSPTLCFWRPASFMHLLFICQVGPHKSTLHVLWREGAASFSTNWVICHKQHVVFNIQIKTSLSHSSRPFWQKPSHVCQEYRVQLRTNFKMNLKSICHQIFMPLSDYLWHFNYKHPRRGGATHIDT